VGLSKSYLSELEAGNKKVTLEVLEKYSSAFRIPISSLMLFAERAAQSSLSDRARGYVADKVVKMLEWIEMLTESDETGRRDEKK
jgi:transcriptional regulator with XRE-family HTH domain